jgi:hypothetical protein
MSIFLSPGVYVQEKDISDVAPRVATSSAALVGYSAKGNVDNILLITSDQQFIENYGEPDPTSGHYFHYAALAFLARGNVLYCLRVENGALLGGANIMHSSSSEVNAAFSVGASSATFSAPSGFTSDVAFQIFGADPGVWNNKIAITISDVKDGTDPVPTDQYTFVINVFYQNDDGAYEAVESWKVSRKKKFDGFGKQLFLEDKINGVSKYIVVKDSALVDTVVPKDQSTNLIFAGGTDGDAISSSELVSGWDEFSNPDDVDIRLLINGGETDIAVQSKMKSIAESRFDCLAILDIPYASTNTVQDMLTFRNTTQNFNSSYCALYAPWPTVYDPYNDLLIKIPPSGHVTAQIAYTDYIGNPWDAPAGFTRGVLDVLEIVKLDGKPFDLGERDVLYPAQINPLQMFRGEGNVIWGQKTEQTKSSALSRVNVRRLLIMIEKTLAITLRQFTFEPNNELTRFRIESVLNEYLEKLSSQGAFQLEGGDRGYHVVCDETNNTPAVIDSFQLNVDVFIKPVRSAEFIQLRIIPTKTGASFQELIAKGIVF